MLRWPTPTSQSFVTKFREEVDEFTAAPSLEEAVDALVCLVGWAHRSGHALEDLAVAGEAKLEINRARRWQRRADGTYKHVD